MAMTKCLVLAVAVLALGTMMPHLGTADASVSVDSVSGVAAEHVALRSDDEAADLDAAFDEAKEEFEFQAEVGRLMDIIINSLYQNKDIFLRELISNASDALDKVRFLSLADPEFLGDHESLEMKISFDEKARTLTITDTGIGMTKQDLIENLGTVAKSGTTQFVEAIANTGDLSLIGQFGVGFYSVYLVADKVRVASKHADDVQHIWESTADDTFSVAEDPRGDTLGRGTEITLFLKDDASEFLDQDRLEALVKRYSEFVTFPIFLNKWTMEEVEIEDEEDEDDLDDEEEADEDEDEETDDEDEDAEEDEDLDEDLDEDEDEVRTERVKVFNWVLVNNQKAIWTRDRSEVEDSEYNEFYKSLSGSYDDPATWIHFKAEGEIEFRSILFVPSKAQTDMYDNYYATASNIRLYVRKVLITDEFEEMLPRYLNFVKGVVDSDDLPLNVSRETLQQHKVLKVMGKKLTRKVLEMLRKLSQKASKDAEESDDEEDEEGSEVEEKEEEEKEDPYIKFWEEFGKNIKLGLIEDSSNRTKLSKLLRFKTSTSNGEWTSFEEYVDRMKDWQKNIYFIAGSNSEEVMNSPMLEVLKNKGLEVIYFTDPIDEIAIQNLTEFDGHRLQSVTKEGLEFGDEDQEVEKKRIELYDEKFAPLTTWMKDVYGDKVNKIAFSTRLDTTPCVLVTSQYGYSANMERVMKNQAFSDPKKQMAYMTAQKTMELNPRHPIFSKLLDMVDEFDGDASEDGAKDLALLLLDTATLQSGFTIDDTAAFAKRMYSTVASGLSLDSTDLLPEMEVPDEPEEEDEDDEEIDDLDDEEDDEEGEEGHEEL